MTFNGLLHLKKEKEKGAATYILWLLFFLLGGITFSQAQDIVLDDPNTSVTEGNNFTITAQMQAGVSQLTAVELQLVFDPTFVEIVSVTPVTAGFFPIVADTVDNTTGRFVYFGGAFPPFPSGTFNFVEIEFLAKTVGTTTIGFSQTKPTIVTGLSGPGNLLQNATPSTVTISPLNCQPLTAQTPELCPADAGIFDLTSLESGITSQAGTFSYATGGNTINNPSNVAVTNGQVIDVTFNGNDGCVATTTITFDVAPPITGTFFLALPATCGLDNAGIQFVGPVGGGIPPFSFSLDGNDFTNTTGTFSNLSAGSYTYYIQDARGCQFTLPVTLDNEADTTDPVALCKPNFTVNLDALTGIAAISVQDIDDGSSDNCGITNIQISQNIFTCADLGDNTVVLTVEDAMGNTSTCTTIVTVDGSNVLSPVTNISLESCNPQDVGVDSTLLVNQFGCDSLVIVTTTQLPSDLTNISAGICQGESFDFNGQSLTTAGTYQADLTNEFGCDSTVILTLSVDQVITSNVIQRICQGDTFFLGSQQLTATGAYTETFVSSAGCDSVVNLALFVDPVPMTSLNATICANETFDFGGQQLNAAGTYVDTLVAATGCDSIVTLNLNVNPTFTTSISETICANESFLFDGQFFNQTGTYQATLTSQDGCDSVVTLNLNVLPTISVQTTETICSNETFSFGGQILDTPGTYTATFTAANGCDSTVTLTLNVNQTLTTSLTATICDNESFLFDGQQLSLPGSYSATFLSQAGCDSTVNLTLVVNPTFSESVSETICSNETFAFNGQQLSSAGTYTGNFTSQNGCDSIVTLTLNVNEVDSTFLTELTCNSGEVGSTSVTLTNEDGCDSVVTTTKFLDNIPPVVSCQNVSVTLDGNGQGTLTAAEVNDGSTDNCGIASLELSKTNFSCTDVGTLDVVLRVTDNAGNVDSCTATVTVTASDPLACLSLKIEGDSLIGVTGNTVTVPFRVKDFNTITGGQGAVNWDSNVLSYVGATRNPFITNLVLNNPAAGQLTYSFFDLNLVGFNLNDGDTLFTIEFLVVGNQGTSSAVALTNNPIAHEYFRAPTNAINFQLINGFVDVPFDVALSGIARTEDGTTIPGVSFSLSGFNGPQTQVGNPGYSFLVTPGTAAEVGAYKNNDIDRDNGVSVFDILLTSLEITGIQDLSSPYKRIAADVNYSGSINSLDLLLMQFFIVQVNPGFPDPFNPPAINRLWTFLPSDYVFTDSASPIPFDTSRVYNFALGGANQDFIGVKLGDVNNDWNSAIPRRKNLDPLYFDIDSKQVHPGEEFTIPVKVRKFDRIAGYQFTLEWDAKSMELLGVDQANLQGVFGMDQKEKGFVTVLWNHPAAQPIKLEDGSEVFTLRFRATAATGSKADISFNGEVIPMEAYTDELKGRSIIGSTGTVQIGNISTSSSLPNELSYSLTPQPNPFSNDLALNLTIPQRTEVKLEIINNLGQVIKNFEQEFDAGEHQVKWDGKTEDGKVIPVGIYYVRMITTDHQQVISVRKKY